MILDTDAPYIKVRRAWHTESNRPVIMTELKTPAARRDIAIPKGLADCLEEAKKNRLQSMLSPTRRRPSDLYGVQKLVAVHRCPDSQARKAKKSGWKVCEIYALPPAW